MSFLELVNKRLSFRGFLDKQIEQEKIDYILECSHLAPSAANRQPWKIYLVKDLSVRKKLYESYERDWFLQAPMMAVFVGLKDQNWVRNYDNTNYLLCDVTIVADYFLLAAAEVDLGTCYIAAFNKEKVIKALDLPDSEEPLLLTPLGYPAQNSSRERNRKDIGEIYTII